MPAEAPKVLVVDDEFDIREIIELNLKLRGYAVSTAEDGVEGLRLVRDWHPDLIILDVVMPKIDGFTLLPAFRRLTEAPIVMLTAKSDIEDRVRGLESGADDYIAKPFEMRELLARVEARLLRPSLDPRKRLSVNDLTMDLQTYVVTRGNNRIDVSAREFNVLATLLRHPGQVFTREELLSAVWGADTHTDVGVVDRTISNLQAKIDRGFDKSLIQPNGEGGFSLRE